MDRRFVLVDAELELVAEGREGDAHLFGLGGGRTDFLVPNVPALADGVEVARPVPVGSEFRAERQFERQFTDDAPGPTAFELRGRFLKGDV